MMTIAHSVVAAIRVVLSSAPDSIDLRLRGIGEAVVVDDITSLFVLALLKSRFPLMTTVVKSAM